MFDYNLPADILGRDEIRFASCDAKEDFSDRVVLITGGGGSVGSALCKVIAKLSPKKLIIVDNYENTAYETAQELSFLHGDSLSLCVEIASVQDGAKMDKIFKKHTPDIVYHAAAHKHVPLMEQCPEEAVKNNVQGTLNVVGAADKYKVKKFVLISTDKAVEPISVMGATKRCCELIVQAKNEASDTNLCAVRFGNILISHGSVIPVFNYRIQNGGPVTVTDPEVTRFFMTIREATELLIEAVNLSSGGEIFVPDMGEPVKILDIAKNMIKRSGKSMDIRFTGSRPGDKLHEKLVAENEVLHKTKNEKIFSVTGQKPDPQKLQQQLDALICAANENDSDAVRKMLWETVKREQWSN